MVSKINQLITNYQHRILRKAAVILMLSDKHDAVFFNELKAIRGESEDTENQVRLGHDYVLARVQVTDKRKTVEISEVLR